MGTVDNLLKVLEKTILSPDVSVTFSLALSFIFIFQLTSEVN